MQTDIKLPSHLPDAFSSAIGLLGDPFRVMIDGKPRYYSPCWSTGIRTRHNAPMTSAYRRGRAFIEWFIRSDYMQSREFGSSSDEAEEWLNAVSQPKPVQHFGTAPAHHGDGWGYLIYADGSMYYWNNGQDEVWADGRDFVIEHLCNREWKEDQLKSDAPEIDLAAHYGFKFRDGYFES